MDDNERVVREAEDFLSDFTRSDLLYRDSVQVGGELDANEVVCVATYGHADELLANDEPERWPIRVSVRNADRDEAGAYLTIAEADLLCREIRKAIRRARAYPQPE